jgi:hypothetical protein
MNDDLWLWGVRAAGGLHLITVLVAWFTPIPPDWERNLAGLPEMHRRFAVAQNLAIGGVMVFLGLVCLGWAPILVEGGPGGRLWAAAVALWWGGRLLLLPWLGVRPTLTSARLRVGYRLLQAQCLIYALAFGWLVLR